MPRHRRYAPKGTFEHWAHKGWDWIINSTADWGIAMSLINQKHWAHSIRVIHKVVQMYGKHPSVWGLSPVNEVGAWTPMDVLRKFYWEAYGHVRHGAPHWIFVMDSSFRGGEVFRDDFMRGCPNKAVDKHPYHAWAPWGQVETYYKRSCGWADENVAIEEEVDVPVIAGEWSLAMDTCAMWLLGFNDMQPGEPRAIRMDPAPKKRSTPSQNRAKANAEPTGAVSARVAASCAGCQAAQPAGGQGAGARSIDMLQRERATFSSPLS